MSKSYESLGYLTGSLYRMLNKTFNNLYAAHNIDLTIEQWVVLKKIILLGPMTQTQITKCIQKDKTTITRAIDSLTKNGFVVRTDSPTDRRVHVIKLTQKGRETMDYLEPLRNEQIDQATSFMSDKEYENFKDNLKKIKENLIEML